MTPHLTLLPIPVTVLRVLASGHLVAAGRATGLVVPVERGRGVAVAAGRRLLGLVDVGEQLQTHSGTMMRRLEMEVEH